MYSLSRKMGAADTYDNACVARGRGYSTSTDQGSCKRHPLTSPVAQYPLSPPPPHTHTPPLGRLLCTLRSSCFLM